MSDEIRRLLDEVEDQIERRLRVEDEVRRLREELEARPTVSSSLEQVVRAYVESGAWAETAWSGHRVARCPNDLWTYAEMVHDLRPDRIVQVPVEVEGGLGFYLACLLEVEGAGRVVSIGESYGPRPEHRRLQVVEAPVDEDSGWERVERAVTGASSVLVFAEPAYEVTPSVVLRAGRFVTPGSYLVVEGTISDSGKEAAEAVLATDLFDVDADRTRHGVTFNPGGFLLRRP